jgi:hypothetical protein
MTNFKSIKGNTSNDNHTTIQTRRQYPRRAHDVVMVNVDGHPYPVLDWSQCGVLFEGDSRFFAEDLNVNMILRFKVGNHIEDVKVSGKVVRTNNHTVAVTYSEAPEDIVETFNDIIRKSA